MKQWGLKYTSCSHKAVDRSEKQTLITHQLVMKNNWLKPATNKAQPKVMVRWCNLQTDTRALSAVCIDINYFSHNLLNRYQRI